MECDKQVEQDRQRAEVFDALGHPTRIQILKVLSEGSLGFADLKKKTGIESGGHLQHHMTKLNGLIKTDEYGKYCLSDEGKDALLIVQTVENSSPRTVTKGKECRHFKVGLKPIAFLFVALLVASTAIAVYEFNQAVVFQEKFTSANSLATAYYNEEETAYFDEFGLIPLTNVNASFTPPISMYRALQIALETDGWNKTTLNGMVVGAYLMHGYFYTNSSLPPDLNINGPVTIPPPSYDIVYSSTSIYHYVWEITVSNASNPIRHLYSSFSLIDASTGQILPNPPLWT
jgi:DNA-binding transcriptional ArsR family regulator